MKHMLELKSCRRTACTRLGNTGDCCTKDKCNAKRLPQRAAEIDKREKSRKERGNKEDRTRRRTGIAWLREVAALLCGITVAKQLSVV